MSYIALDIETVANGDMVSKLPEPEVKLGNLKDPAKINEKIVEAKQKQIEGMALDPLYGKVCCVGMYFFTDPEGDDGRYETLIGGEEADILKETAKMLTGHNGLITFNGKNFDIPFLLKRMAILNVPNKLNIHQLTEPNYDVMQMWAGRNGYVSLNTLADIVLGEKKEELDVRLISLYIANGKEDKVIEYCKRDVELTAKLFKRIRGIFA